MESVSDVPQDRFYISVVNPVLERTTSFVMKKSPTNVGFFPSCCDVVIPYEDMMLDRTDFFEHPDDFKEEDFPTFTLQYMRKEDTWKLFFRKLNCDVEILSRHCHSKSKFVKSFTLQNADCIKFEWSPLHELFWGGIGANGERRRDIRCFFYDKGPVTGNKEDEDQESPEAFNLLHLPIRYIGKVASYMEPKEFVSTLGASSAMFANTRRLVPWRKLTLTEDTESLLVAQLASIKALAHLQLRALDPHKIRDVYITCWSRLLRGSAIRKLEVPSFRFLQVGGVPRNLTHFYGVQFSGDNDVEHLLGIGVPSTVSTVVFGRQEGSGELWSNGELFFAVFPNATRLCFSACPQVQFWNSTDKVKAVTHLKVRLVAESGLRLSRLWRVEFLSIHFEVRGSSSNFWVGSWSLMHLRVLEMACREMTWVWDWDHQDTLPSIVENDFWVNLAARAPNVTYLLLHANVLDDDTLARIIQNFPHLTCFVSAYSGASANGVVDFILAGTELKHVDVVLRRTSGAGEVDIKAAERAITKKVLRVHGLEARISLKKEGGGFTRVVFSKLGASELKEVGRYTKFFEGEFEG